MPWTCHSCRDVGLLAHGYIASSENLHSILATWKCDYSSVMRLSTHRYLASSKSIIRLLVAWKWDPWRVMCCVTVRVFHGLKIRLLRFPKTLGSRFRVYLLAHILYLGDLKMWLLLGRDTVNSILHELFWKPFLQFCGIILSQLWSNLDFGDLRMRLLKCHETLDS